MQLAFVAMLASDFGDIAVDVVNFRWTSLGQVLIHGRIVQRMCHARGVQNGFDFRFARAQQLVSGCFGRTVGFIDQLFGEPTRVGMRMEFAETNLVHGTQRVQHRVEYDFRHAHADEVVHDGRVERGRCEILVQRLLVFAHLVSHIIRVGTQVHGLGMYSAGEVEIAGAVHVGTDQCGAAVNAVCGEVFVELFEVSIAVHGGEHDLLLIEQMGAALEHAVKLHLLEEHDPHVRLAGVFLRIVHVDRHEMAVFTVLRHVGTALLADLLDIRLPCIDEVDVFVREFLQQRTVLDAHSAGTDHCVLHVPRSSLVKHLACFSSRQSQDIGKTTWQHRRGYIRFLWKARIVIIVFYIALSAIIYLYVNMII